MHVKIFLALIFHYGGTLLYYPSQLLLKIMNYLGWATEKAKLWRKPPEAKKSRI